MDVPTIPTSAGVSSGVRTAESDEDEDITVDRREFRQAFARLHDATSPAALGIRAFEILQSELDAQAATSDPAEDLIQAGLMFRRFALEHPSLFQIGFQHFPIAPDVAEDFRPTQSRAFLALIARIERLDHAGGLRGRAVMDAVLAFDALTEGLATIELRHVLPDGREETVWRHALDALVHGFTRPTET